MPYKLSKLNQEGTENLNRPITTHKIEVVTKKKLPTNRSSGLDDFTGEFYQIFKELISLRLKLFPKIQEKGRPQAHFTKPALS